MNPNLKRLVEQAKKNEPFECACTKEQWLETFAGLIVEDTIKLLRLEWYALNNEEVDVDITPRDIGFKVGQKSEIIVLMEKIKKHFGVSN